MEMATGRLMRLALDAKEPEGVERLPSLYDKLAMRKIEAAEKAGIEPRVNLRSQHPLSQWARDMKKRKAKIAAASRRRNRHGKR